MCVRNVMGERAAGLTSGRLRGPSDPTWISRTGLLGERNWTASRKRALQEGKGRHQSESLQLVPSLALVPRHLVPGLHARIQALCCEPLPPFPLALGCLEHLCKIWDPLNKFQNQEALHTARLWLSQRQEHTRGHDSCQRPCAAICHTACWQVAGPGGQ